MTASRSARVDLPPADELAAPASLARAVLAEEARRQAEQARRSAPITLPDDLLPGVGGEQMGFRDTLRLGGWTTLLVAVLVTVVEQLSREATGVLGPDIQTTFGISDTTLIGITSFGGVALVLGAVPMAWLADRIPRKRIVVASGCIGVVGLLLAAVAVNTFQLFWAFVLIGLSTAYSNPVFGSLLSDKYPLQARSRVFAIYAMATPLGLVVGPLIAGSIAAAAGGDEGWRWAFAVLVVPVLLLVVTAGLRLEEPPRGQFEQEAIFGGVVLDANQRTELPITISTAYQRMKKIKTFSYICMGIGVLGLGLITVPAQISLLLRDSYGYDAYTRGWVLSLAQIPSIAVMILAGYLYDRAYRSRPELVLRVGGICIALFGLFVIVGVRFQPIGLLVGSYALALAAAGAAAVAVGPIVASVAPFRLRAQAFAIVPVFTFLMGGFLGGLLAGALSDAHGHRTALTIVVPISAVSGGYLFWAGARYLKRDISLAVEELLEDQQERQRMSASATPPPVLQVRNLDFSYGPVQVLFDISLEVHRGEVVALLGTNGAGKSTLLRAISGLGIPDRGVVRLDGRTITYAETEARFGLGIVQLRGGHGVFADMSVEENLRAALVSRRLEPAEEQRLVDRAMDRLPALAERAHVEARDLSGGQQQMLAMAMTLVHEPQLLIIDELSLGLAPIVVHELLEVLERLKADGTTMIIVEQSLNIALSCADRAIFMEKGRVQFEGPAAELLERDDLARAVFLGSREH